MSVITAVTATSKKIFWIFFLSLLLSFVKGDFGDYADDTFECPALTTCAQVCVPSLEDCPLELQLCPNNPNESIICNDGSCAVDGQCDPFLENPCLDNACDTHNVACARIVDTYDRCLELYDPLITQANECAAETAAELSNPWRWNQPSFIFVYVWVASVTFFIVAWCWFNQKISPVPGSTALLQVNANENNKVADADADAPTASASWQTGYRKHWLGTILYVLTLLTFVMWPVLLMIMSVMYYVNDNTDEEEQMLLRAFIVTWNAGFLWTLPMKYPPSLQHLFLRRCSLTEATHVAVFLVVPPPKVVDAYKADVAVVRILKQVLQAFVGTLAFVLKFLFADDVDAQQRTQGIFEYCPVVKQQDQADTTTTTTTTKYFTFVFRRYNLDVDQQLFVPGHYPVGHTLQDLATAGSQPLTTNDVLQRRAITGSNKIEMKPPSFMASLSEEFSKIFYIYQMYIILMWFPLWYYYMAVTWGVVVITSAFVLAYFHFRSTKKIYEITNVEGETKVLRDGDFTTISQEELVPGDVVKLSPGTRYCDMVLLSGETIVDESALTGEATPTAKASLEPSSAIYDYSLHKRQTISAGTSILECSEAATALVLSTASYTTKGQLLREIISFRRHRFKFDDEVLLALFILFCVALFGFCMVLYFVADQLVYGWFYGMYVVAAVLPALLPTVFTVAVGVSEERLSMKGVACSHAESILISGKVRMVLFDKTGTLTRQGLELINVTSASSWNDEEQKALSQPMAEAMVACHSVTMSTGGLIGNPVDCTMFEASGATILDKEDSPKARFQMRNGEIIKVLRSFQFDHSRMTQSVVVELPNGALKAYVKGSGDSIRKLCKSLPSDYASRTQLSAKLGVYQISVASKDIDEATDVSSLTRDDIEKDLSFEGLVDFENVLRDETPSVIEQLVAGAIVPVMVTGDSVLTGIHIAREAGILENDATVLLLTGNEGSASTIWLNADTEEPVSMPSVDFLRTNGKTRLAVSGNAWGVFQSEDKQRASELAPFVRVFGRCQPTDKVAVVETFSNLGYVTLFVGDGANDVGALQCADSGVALSDTEASIVAPFTSLNKEIASVVELLKEGRCSLASAFATYKFLVMYGLISWICQVIMAYFQITFTEWSWVFVDGVWAVALSMGLSLARPAAILAPSRPTAALLGPTIVSSVTGMVLIDFLFLVFGLLALNRQDFFACRQWTPTDLSNILVIGDNYETEVIFLICGFQLVTAAIVYNYGYEFRQAGYKNLVHIFMVSASTFILFYITFIPGRMSCFFRVNCENDNVVRSVTSFELMPIQNPFNTTVMPLSFRWIIAVIMASNTLAVVLYEYWLVNGIRRRRSKSNKQVPKINAKENAHSMTNATEEEQMGLSVTASA